MSFCEATYERIHNDWLRKTTHQREHKYNFTSDSYSYDSILSQEERDLLTTQCQSYVLHRLRFIHYHNYLIALLSATSVLDTFPYGGIILYYLLIFYVITLLPSVGCLTSHDAMSNGIPMVTLPLEHVR